MFSTPFTFLKAAGSTPPPIDPNAAAFLAATGITDPTISSAINTLVVDLKTAGLWNYFYAIWPMVGGTATTCKYNLVDPADTDAAFRLTFAGGMAFNDYGIVGNGSNSYAETHWSLGTDLTDYSSLSWGLYCLDNKATVQNYINFVCSVADNTYTNPTSASIDLGANSNYAFYDPGSESNRQGGSSGDPQGLIWIDQISYTSRKLYRNDTAFFSNNYDNSATASDKNYRTFTIGCQTSGNLGFTYSTANTYSFGFAADGIPYADATTFYNIVETFQTTLGRSVSQVDQDVLNYVNQISRTGATLTSAETSAINTLVSDMKFEGIWSKMHVVYPYIGGSSAAFKYNLINPVDSDVAFRATFYGPFNFTSSGLVGTGINYVDTHFTLADFSSPQILSVGSYVLNNVPVDAIGQVIPYTVEYPWGGSGPYPTYSSFLNLGLGTNLGLIDPGAEDYRTTWAPPANTYGMNAWNNPSFTSHRVYLNKTLIGNGTTNSSGANTTTNPFKVGRNISYETKQTIAFSFIGDALTEAEYFDYVDIVQAFQTAFGRQV